MATAKPKLAPQGCKGYRPPRPRAAASIGRRSRTLKLRVSAGEYTRLRVVGVTLPKGDRGQPQGPVRQRGQEAARQVAAGEGAQAHAPPPRARAPTTVRLSAKRVRVSRKLVGKRVRSRVSAKDDTGRTVKLSVRTRVRR